MKTKRILFWATTPLWLSVEIAFAVLAGVGECLADAARWVSERIVDYDMWSDR